MTTASSPYTHRCGSRSGTGLLGPVPRRARQDENIRRFVRSSARWIGSPHPSVRICSGWVRRRIRDVADVRGEACNDRYDARSPRHIPFPCHTRSVVPGDIRAMDTRPGSGMSTQPSHCCTHTLSVYSGADACGSSDSMGTAWRTT